MDPGNVAATCSANAVADVVGDVMSSSGESAIGSAVVLLERRLTSESFTGVDLTISEEDGCIDGSGFGEVTVCDVSLRFMLGVDTENDFIGDADVGFTVGVSCNWVAGGNCGDCGFAASICFTRSGHVDDVALQVQAWLIGSFGVFVGGDTVDTAVAMMYSSCGRSSSYFLVSLFLSSW